MVIHRDAIVRFKGGSESPDEITLQWFGERSGAVLFRMYGHGFLRRPRSCGTFLVPNTNLCIVPARCICRLGRQPLLTHFHLIDLMHSYAIL